MLIGILLTVLLGALYILVVDVISVWQLRR